MGIVYTIREKCKRCYACIRSCPVKAIKVKEGRAEVIKERCVVCGTCVNVCALKAKQYETNVGEVWELLGRFPRVIAVLDPSSPAAFNKVHPRQLVSALKKLGFCEVMDGAFGAELVAKEYRRIVRESGGKHLIASHCAAIVFYVEKYHPHLLDNLVPVVSPMIAMGRAIKKHYGPGAKVVYISPCIAQKREINDEKVAGAVDAVLTFVSLTEMFKARGINPLFEENSPISGPQAYQGRFFPLSGGFVGVANITDNFWSSELMVVEGRGYVSESLRELTQRHISPRFIDVRLCHGCLGGPAMGDAASVFRRREIIIDYGIREADRAQTEQDLVEYGDVELSRGFTNRSVPLTRPAEEEIREILKQIDRTAPEDELNCGACGYNTCRDMAIAIHEDLAEKEMCWPYLLERLQATQEELMQAEKLTSLGQMAASIAHEINNPLAGVLVYAQLMSKKVAGDSLPKETALNYLAKMESEIIRSSRIIRNLLDFARQTEPMLRLVDINQLMEQVLSLVGHQAVLQNIEVVKEFLPSPPQIRADFDQLQQVFTNLVLNAIQAMSNGGRLFLRTSVVSEDKLAPGKPRWVKVDVGDSGCGISPENMRKLFTPFFTTKEKGKGVGLGLAVAYGIIQRHKGKIEVQSEVGKGTTFSVYLEVYYGEKS